MIAGPCAAGAQPPYPELRSPQDLPGLESQRESLEQPFLSVFKRGRRRVPVRSLGKVVHYAKVQLRFQHSQVGARPGGVRGAWPAAGPQLLSQPLLPQDVSDCYLELFPSHLYFQAHGSEGLTFQVRDMRRGGKLPGRPGHSHRGPSPAFPCALLGTVTTDGAEHRPTGGVHRACLPDHRCVGHAGPSPGTPAGP